MFIHKPPRLIAISGISGTGKTTLIAKLEAFFGGGRVVTYTTRPKRPTEKKTDYHFCSKAQLDQLTDALWIKENYGNWYAVTRNAFEVEFKKFGVAIIPTITSHHETLQIAFPNTRYLGIHLLSPEEGTLRCRMQKRGENEKTIAERLQFISAVDSRVKKIPFVNCLQPTSPTKVLAEVLALL